MFSFFSSFFAQKGIDCFGWISLEDCRILRPYLLERNGIGRQGTVCMLAAPYYTEFCDDERRNLSAYAVSRDYHLFYKELFDELLPLLRERFPQYRFAGFADHSPIDEVHAAARAGLGVIGKNHLLLTDKYSSYVFLGAVVTDAVSPCEAKALTFCRDCGACQAVCPMEKGGACLSSLSQKKGDLSPEEIALLQSHNLVWGCDRCQEICPHTREAKARGTLYSPIPFFAKEPIPFLSEKHLLEMSDEEFSKRAYSWRGRAVILRNLRHLKQNGKENSKC